MASKLLNSVAGGGAFVAGFMSGVIQINSGATGTLATITPSTGKKLKLTLLRSGTGTPQTNLTTVTVGGAAVISAITLAANTNLTGGDIAIGGGNNSNDSLLADVDDVIVISTNVATSQNTWYAYEESK